MSELDVTRRRFLRGSATATVGTALLPHALWAWGQDAVLNIPRSINRVGYEKVLWSAQPFPLEQVRLRSGYLKEMQERNRVYLMMLPNDRLAHSFRLTAGKPSTAQPLGGWEAPDCELRGHLAGGHYLSACALMYASTGDETLRLKAGALVNILAECLQPNGYLGAYPESFYERLKNHEQVWAPFYTYHKIMAGHLDMYIHCGNLTAFETVQRMAHWAMEWIKKLSDEELAKVQMVEHGGMNEVMFNLYAITGEKKYLDAGYRFEHKRFFEPLAAHQDKLAGLHSNTNIPKVLGAARGYELTGDERYRDLTEYFWHTVVEHHSFAPGGTSNNNEGWSEPDTAGTHMAAGGQECCCSYNMLKLTRHLFGWKPQAAWMDYYEKLLWNLRAGTQNDEGMLMYYVPTIPGGWKTFGDPYEANLCCTGSGAEEFAKLVDTIYFHDAESVYVNQFISSELDWRNKKIRIVQQTDFPVEEATTLEIHTQQPQQFKLRLRWPHWAAKIELRVNGQLVAAHKDESGYAVLERQWTSGDKVQMTMPMSLRQEAVPGSPDLTSLAYGPLVLVACMGTEGLSREMINAGQGPDMDKLPALPLPETAGQHASWVKKTDEADLCFASEGQKKNFQLKPLCRVMDERFSVYWKQNTAL